MEVASEERRKQMRKISLKAARVASDMTQEKLAEKMGVTRQTVTLWELGKLKMSRRAFLAFCSVTGFNEDEIFLPEIIAERNDKVTA